MHFIKKLRDEISNLFSGSPIKRLVRKIDDSSQKFKNIELICRIQVEFDENLLPTLFCQYFSSNFDRFQGNLDNLEMFLEKIHQKFIKNFNLQSDFTLPTLNHLKEFYWNTQQYEIAYSIMALEDFQ